MHDRRQAVLELIAEISDQPVETLRPETELVGELGIDSPKALQLLMEIEDRLQLEIGDEEAEGLSTVGDVLAFVEGAEGRG